MLGMIDDLSHITTQWFKNVGDVVVLVGQNRDDLGGSEYLKTIHDLITGDAPYLDLEEEKRVQELVRAAIRAGLVQSAHDVSDGGLAVCLAECCMTNPDHLFGCTITLKSDIRPDALWFGESQSRVVLSLPRANRALLKDLAVSHNIPISLLGEVTDGMVVIDGLGTLNPADLHERYYTCLPRLQTHPWGAAPGGYRPGTWFTE
jgi:phosphoribosylformylglycinamidine synthase